MHNKNVSIFFCFTFFSALIMLIIGCYLSLLNSLDGVEELNERVNILELSNQRYESEIESLKERMGSYELENNESKDTTISNVKKEPSKKYSESDLTLMAQLIESESGNQSFEGKLAVGTVVMNRVASDEFPDNIEDVVFQKGQFSVVSDGSIYNEPSEESLEAAKDILEGLRVLDSDVLYFYNPDLVKKNWIQTRKVTKKIDDHAFAI